MSGSEGNRHEHKRARKVYEHAKDDQLGNPCLARTLCWEIAAPDGGAYEAVCQLDEDHQPYYIHDDQLLLGSWDERKRPTVSGDYQREGA